MSCDEFKDDSGNLFEVTKNGMIKTGDRRGKASLVVESDDHSLWEDESIYINVMISNIFSIFVKDSYKVKKHLINFV